MKDGGKEVPLYFPWPTVFQTAMSQRDVRYYKFTLQVPLGKPDATFRRSQRQLERPDVDYCNGFASLDFNLGGDINFSSGNLLFAYLYKN